MPLDVRRWTARHWTLMASVLGGIVLLSQAVGAVTTTLEPYLLATRGWAREQIAEATKGLTAAIAKNDVGFLDIQLLVLDGQITTLMSQISMLKLRLQETPTDPFLVDLQAQYSRQLQVAQERRSRTSCQRTRIDYPAASC